MSTKTKTKKKKKPSTPKQKSPSTPKQKSASKTTVQATLLKIFQEKGEHWIEDKESYKTMLAAFDLRPSQVEKTMLAHAIEQYQTSLKTLEWTGPTSELFGVSTFDVWETTCGRYKVARITGPEPRFACVVRNGTSERILGNNLKSLERAFEIVTDYHKENVCKTEVNTNAVNVLANATRNGHAKLIYPEVAREGESTMSTKTTKTVGEKGNGKSKVHPDLKPLYNVPVPYYSPNFAEGKKVDAIYKAATTGNVEQVEKVKTNPDSKYGPNVRIHEFKMALVTAMKSSGKTTTEKPKKKSKKSKKTTETK